MKEVMGGKLQGLLLREGTLFVKMLRISVLAKSPFSPIILSLTEAVSRCYRQEYKIWGNYTAIRS